MSSPAFSRRAFSRLSFQTNTLLGSPSYEVRFHTQLTTKPFRRRNTATRTQMLRRRSN